MPATSSATVTPIARLTSFNLFAFSAGVCSLLLWLSMPSAPLLLAIVVVAITLAPLLPRKVRAALICALAGFVWCHLQTSSALEKRLPPSLEGETLWAIGHIVGLPEAKADGWRFRFCPQRIEHDGRPLAIVGCWRLGWYERRFRRDDRPLDVDGSTELPRIEPGERWRLAVRLRRPRGLVNPGGFDSERWALESGTAAVGYVHNDASNQRLGEAGGIDAVRQRISERIDDAIPGRPRMTALLNGLVVGDRRGFTDADWLVFRATGTSHLFSISGLHVGMLAIVVAALTVALTYACPPLLRCRPRRLWAALPAIAVATGYSLLAGFEVPTQRSLAMIAFATLVLFGRRSVSLWQGLCVALASILLVDPLAMLGIGFWLSFMGVMWLLLSAQSWQTQPGWRSILRTQLAITVGLLPVCAGFFGETSWVSAPVNLIAIPWVTFAVVPLALSSLPFLELAPPVAGWLLQSAAFLLDVLMGLLDAIAAWPGAISVLPEPAWPAVFAATFAIAIVLAPLPLTMRLLAIPLTLPLVATWWVSAGPMREGIVQLDVLDVGQGTSVLVRTRTFALLFDTGARIPNGFDAGESVVVPALRALGVDRLDMLILSHADSDHAGGAHAVLKAMPAQEILLGESTPGITGAPCREGMRWHRDGVDFEILHPPVRYPAEGNDVSCVLKIDSAGSGALLTGDAGEVAEMRMLALHRNRLRSDVLLLGHHGSRTSTSAAFLKAVAPVLGIVTAGYRNRFGHPHPKVIRRLAHHGVVVAETSHAGALQVRIENGRIEWHALRERERRFWRER